MEMSRRSVLTSLVFGAVAVKTTGCFGSFRLTRAVYDFNDNISSEKFVKWLMFLVLNIIPVYGVAAFVDSIVINSIEFWTGKNPMASAAEGEEDRRLVQLDSERTLELVREQQGAVLKLVLTRTGEAPVVRTFHLEQDGMVVRDAADAALVEARSDAEGGITVRSAGEVVARYSAAEVRGMEEAYAQGGPTQLARVAQRSGAVQLAAR